MQAGTLEIAPVQVLRAVSALAVSWLHISQSSGALVGRVGEAPYAWLKFLPWDASVDIFFVISGFVMVYASTRMFARPGATRLFLMRRTARVVPLYWVATTLVLIIGLSLPGALSEPLGGGIGAIAASYLFIPWLRPDGFMQPIFRIGWTLNYEALFYALFTCFVAFPRLRATAWIGGILCALAVLGLLFRPANPQLAFWTDPIVVEFGYGMAVATLLLAGGRLGMPARLALGAAGVLILAVVGQADGVWRPIAYGVPATLFLAAAALGRPSRNSLPDPGRSGDGLAARAMRIGVLLGDASYAIYLVHPFPMRALREVWARLGWNGMAGILSYIVATMAVTCVIAIVLHLKVEMPLTRAVRKRLRA